MKMILENVNMPHDPKGFQSSWLFDVPFNRTQAASQYLSNLGSVNVRLGANLDYRLYLHASSPFMPSTDLIRRRVSRLSLPIFPCSKRVPHCLLLPATLALSALFIPRLSHHWRYLIISTVSEKLLICLIMCFLCIKLIHIV